MIGGSAIGVMYAIRYRRRVSELCQLEHIMTFIVGELKYRHMILGDVFGRASSRFGQVFQGWLLHLQQGLQENATRQAHEIWADSLSLLRTSTCLKKPEMDVLETLGYTLGGVDLETQLQELAIVSEQIHDIRIGAECGLANKIKVTVVLAIVASILLVVILL